MIVEFPFIQNLTLLVGALIIIFILLYVVTSGREQKGEAD